MEVTTHGLVALSHWMWCNVEPGSASVFCQLFEFEELGHVLTRNWHL